MGLPTEDIYYSDLQAKISCLEKEIINIRSQITTARKGRIATRNRANGRRYYWIAPSGRRTGPKLIEKDITKDYVAQRDLLDKFYKMELLRRQERNLKVFKEVIKKYHRIAPSDILETKDEKFRQQWKAVMAWTTTQNNNSTTYQKKQFDPSRHIHQVSSGEWVRSKGEVIIYEKLAARGYPFHYEEKFPVATPGGYWIYPDFKVMLPNGDCIWWEHCGLMNDLNYCAELSKRLQHYQNNGVTIGKNLVITADDIKGDCSGQLIERAIDFYIAPHFR